VLLPTIRALDRGEINFYVRAVGIMKEQLPDASCMSAFRQSPQIISQAAHFQLGEEMRQVFSPKRYVIEDTAALGDSRAPDNVEDRRE